MAASKTPTQAPIELFHPRFVCALGFLFTPLLGAMLQARNWEALGQYDEARASRFWGRSALWLIGVYIAMQVIFHDQPIFQGFAIYFIAVMWLAWMVTSGFKQLRYLKAHPNLRYTNRPLGKVITLGVAGWLFYGLVMVTIAMGLKLLGIDLSQTLTTTGTQNVQTTGPDEAIRIRVPHPGDAPVIDKVPVPEPVDPFVKAPTPEAPSTKN